MHAGDSDSEISGSVLGDSSGHRSRLVRCGLLIVAMTLCGAVLGCGKQQQGTSSEEVPHAKFSEEAEKAANDRRELIRAELVSLGGNHEWAAEYYCGDGKGVNVSLFLSPNNGYVFEWHGCLGVYDRNYGTVTATDGKLRLSFTYENKQEGFPGIASEFVTVAWGSRKYLIPSDDIVGFCNQVNSRSEPRDELYGWYLLREGDEKVKVTGLPSVPPQYADYLLTQPVKARIIRVKVGATHPGVGGWNFRDTTVALDAGKADHLLVGMDLDVVKPEDSFESVRIVEVKDHTAKAVMRQDAKDAEPQAGWELSTLPRWRDPIAITASDPVSQPAAETQPAENTP